MLKVLSSAALLVMASAAYADKSPPSYYCFDLPLEGIVYCTADQEEIQKYIGEAIEEQHRKEARRSKPAPTLRPSASLHNL